MPIRTSDQQLVALVYDSHALGGDAASRDVLDQIEALERELAPWGLETLRLGMDFNLATAALQLRQCNPALVFNLVESLAGVDRMQTAATMLFEQMQLPFTGSGSVAMLLANNKVECKRVLDIYKIPVAACVWLDASGKLRFFPDGTAAQRGDWIVKAVESHASVFLDDSSVVRDCRAADLEERLIYASRKYGQAFFAERFIDGREFNISVIVGANGCPEVLPVAEISFAELPKHRIKMVGYAAKWHEDSPEYQATPRTFTLAASDTALIAQLQELTLLTWQALGLAGYARVDFRVDGEGRIFVLEANANPCLSPDAGLAAAAEKAGIGYSELIRRIMHASAADLSL